MAVKYQAKKTWTDLLLGRPWRTSKTPMVLADDIVSYNPVYFLILCGLNVQGEDHRWIHAIEFSGNIEKYLSVENSRKSRWMNKYMNEFVKHESRPWFIVNGDADTMARLRFTGKELRSLQSQEIAVYFYEPLFFRGPKFYDSSVRVTFPELDWLQDFNFNHGGKLKIVAYVCDYDLASYVKRWNLYPDIEIRTLDLFVAAYAYDWSRRSTWAVPWSPEKAKKKFICLNFRYEGYRQYVVAYLVGKGHHGGGHISFFYTHNEEHFRYLLPFAPDAVSVWPTVKEGIEKMQPLLPFTLDTTNSKSLESNRGQLPDWKPGENNRNEMRMRDFYSDACICIVNETRYGSANGEISEKTFIPMIMKRPFVVVGAPYMIRYLKEMGFETFGDFWDESYDEIEDHALRMEKVLALLDDLLSKPLSELQDLLVKMRDVLERNRKHFLENFSRELHDRIASDAKGSQR